MPLLQFNDEKQFDHAEMREIFLNKVQKINHYNLEVYENCNILYDLNHKVNQLKNKKHQLMNIYNQLTKKNEKTKKIKESIDEVSNLKIECRICFNLFY
jgi:hypothetical protein